MEAYDTILRLVPSDANLTEKMAQVTPPGLQLPRLDYEQEQKELGRWLRRLLRSEPPPGDLAGVWLGLFHPVGPSGDTLTDFYFSGTARFELDDVDNEWACGPCYFPEGRYAGSGVLASMQLCGNDSGVDLQHMCLGYLAFLAGPLLESLQDLLPNRLGVAVGWDSGDPLYLGFLREGGFQYRDPGET